MALGAEAGAVTAVFRSVPRIGAGITAVGVKDTGFVVLTEVGVQNLAQQAVAEDGVPDRKHYLHAFVQVPRHPIRAAKVQIGLAAMAANHTGLQWGTVRNLLMAWVLTLPVSMMLAGLLFWGFRNIF